MSGAATADFARCELTTTAGHLDGAATWAPHNGDASVTALGTVKLSSTSTFSETCSRDAAGHTTGPAWRAGGWAKTLAGVEAHPHRNHAPYTVPDWRNRRGSAP